jgi:hypothetical protein
MEGCIGKLDHYNDSNICNNADIKETVVKL